MARAAQLGESGDVDGALAATNSADNLGKQHDSLYKQLTEPERTMTVCDICGVFINSTDNEQRRLVSSWFDEASDTLLCSLPTTCRQIRPPMTAVIPKQHQGMAMPNTFVGLCKLLVVRPT